MTQLIDEIDGLVESVDPPDSEWGDLTWEFLDEDLEPIVASCDLANPSSCESCQ